jgi:3-hydroxybutyryl-CoA dehydrogenase
VIVESVSESVPLKQSILAEVSACCDEDAIITTNTSSLDLGQLEASVVGPARFAGLHWFYPAELVGVVEIVASASTATTVLERLEEFADSIGKKVIHARKPVAGFVVNRLQYALLREAHHLIASGVCDATDIDLSLIHCLGPRWCATGPLESMDLAGLDVHLAVAEQLYPKLSDAQKPHAHLIERVAAGELGAKSGRGLRGAYDGASVARLLRHRADIIRALEGAETPT